MRLYKVSEKWSYKTASYSNHYHPFVKTQGRLFNYIEPFKRSLLVPLLFEIANEQWLSFPVLQLGNLKNATWQLEKCLAVLSFGAFSFTVKVVRYVQQ